MRQVKTILFILTALIPALLTAKPSNKELKIGMAQEFENFNPLIKSMLATSYMYYAVGHTLVFLDAKGKYVPQLATRIPTIENKMVRFKGKGKKRKLIVDWEIRENANWGDGQPVTCEDFVFSRNAGVHPNVSTPDKKVYSIVEKITYKKSKPKLCTFTYTSAPWDFVNRGAGFNIVPAHLEKPVFEKYKKEKEGYARHSKYTKDPTNPGLYNGPYRISDIKLSSHVIIVPNEKYYGKKPKIQKVIFKLIQNTSTLEANLRSGTIDMISVLGLSFDQSLAFDKRVTKEKLPFKVNFQPSLVYEHIDINVNNDILKDIHVRKAMVHAINRKELTKALFEGRQPPAIHNITPLDPWYTDNPKKIVLYKYSRRAAKKLLEKSGWKKAKDGFRYKDNKRLSLTIMTTAGNKVREQVQEFLAHQWKKVGIEVKIKNEPARVFFGETVRKGKYPHMAMYAWISSPENDPRSQLHSESIPSEKNGYSGQNSAKWSNKEVDQLIEDVSNEFSAKKRSKMVHRILYHYTNEVPVIPLYYRSDVSVTPKNLTGYVLPGHLFSATTKIENWELK